MGIAIVGIIILSLGGKRAAVTRHEATVGAEPAAEVLAAARKTG